ncbi:MAG: phosphotransferase [Salinibacter sp.]|uniref:maltokinase N-terminal cap-like domain-containing protein n=1 Tax=Salinibacter sp. TaxID=2065818 RepID=UPI0035D428F8
MPEEDVHREGTRHGGPPPADVGASDQSHPVLPVAEGLQNLLVPTTAQHRGPEQFESLLPAFIKKQRWFGAKGEVIEAVDVEDAVRLNSDPAVYISVLAVSLGENTSLYTLPLMAAPAEKSTSLLDEYPHVALAWLEVENTGERRLVHDATVDPEFWATLFRWWRSGSRSRSLRGVYTAEPSEAAKHDDPEDIQLLTGEQSNTSALIDGDYFAKIYRRLEEGPNPEKELLEHLTSVDFAFAPRLHGTVTVQRQPSQYTLAVFQEALDVETDAWSYALGSTAQFLDRIKDSPFPREQVEIAVQSPGAPDRTADRVESQPVPGWLEDVAPEMFPFARTLGARTADMHHALSRAEAKDLHPIEAPVQSGAELGQRLRSEIEDTRAFLDQQAHLTPEDLPSESLWTRAKERIADLDDVGGGYDRIRIHGDYHLGQLLRADGDVYILDFEGEPARPLDERRKRENALRDVAGMLRSLEYAVLAAWEEHAGAGPADQPWIDALLNWVEITFLDAYADTANEAVFLPDPPARYSFLWAFLLDKALYEVRYELNHRPDWAWLPLRGLQRLLGTQDPTDSPNT